MMIGGKRAASRDGGAEERWSAAERRTTERRRDKEREREGNGLLNKKATRGRRTWKPSGGGGRGARVEGKRVGSARIKSIAVRGTTSFAPATFVDIAFLFVRPFVPLLSRPTAPHAAAFFFYYRHQAIAFCFIITGVAAVAPLSYLLLQCSRSSSLTTVPNSEREGRKEGRKEERGIRRVSR